MYYTTLNNLRAHSLCCTGWDKLLRHLGKTETGPDDEPLSLLTILESNGIDDAIWALRAVDDPTCARDARVFAVRCVRQFAQHLLTDPRSLNALDVAELYAIGEATDKELKTAEAAAEAAAEVAHAAAKGAWDAAWAAAWAAARNAAWAANTAAQAAVRAAALADAWNAAWNAINAARDAAWDARAARAAAWDARAASEAQLQDFIDIFCAEDSTCPA